MAFSILVSKRALTEIEGAIDYYATNSNKAAYAFIDELQIAYTKLGNDPFKRTFYKNVRGLALKKFPYILYFVIDEKKQTVKILACFHNKKHPDKRPNI